MSLIFLVVKAVKAPGSGFAGDIQRLRDLGWDDRDIMDALAQGVDHDAGFSNGSKLYGCLTDMQENQAPVNCIFAGAWSMSGRAIGWTLILLVISEYGQKYRGFGMNCPLIALFFRLRFGSLQFTCNDDLDAAVIGASLGGSVLGDRSILALSMCKDAVGWVAFLHEVLANRVSPALRETLVV